jgi:hypothetical protein
MPARPTTVRATNALRAPPAPASARMTTSPTPETTSALLTPSATPYPTSSPSDTSRPEDDPISDITLRLFSVTLNDNGPDMDSPDNRLWRSRADFQRDSLNNDVIPDSPLDVAMEDVMAGLEKISVTSTHTPARTLNAGLTPMERAQCKKDSSRYTTRILEVFDNLEKQLPLFEKDLELFTQSPSHTAFEHLYAKLLGLQSTLDRNKRSSRTLDKMRASLAPKLISLHNRLQELRLLLPEHDDRPRDYPIGK